MFSRHRIAALLGRLFRRGETGTSPAAITHVGLVPLVLPVWAAWADEARPEAAPRQRHAHRPLAAQLAMQARLNVPVGRKPFVASKPAKPINVTKPKRSSVAIGTQLYARPMGAVARPTLTIVPSDGLAAYAGPRIADLAA